LSKVNTTSKETEGSSNFHRAGDEFYLNKAYLLFLDGCKFIFCLVCTCSGEFQITDSSVQYQQNKILCNWWKRGKCDCLSIISIFQHCVKHTPKHQTTQKCSSSEAIFITLLAQKCWGQEYGFVNLLYKQLATKSWPVTLHRFAKKFH